MIKAAVLGSPISHSLSPLLHNSAYEQLGFTGRYEAIEVNAGGLAKFMDGRDETWTGFSLTMPLKEEAVTYAQHVDELAKRINSANTLYRDGGAWRASSTDVLGFSQALKSHRIDIKGHVVILGAGATARAAAAACDGVAGHITVINRSLSRVPGMSDAVLESELSFLNWDDLGVLSDADLVISTAPAGVTDSIELPKKTSAPFFEALYKPWPTPASALWASRGGTVIDGLDLLIHQAIAQISIFSGAAFDISAMYTQLRSVGLAALK
jgi:shikimate dehydrogenase